MTAEEKKFNELMNAAPTPGAGAATKADYNALIEGEKAANGINLDYARTADGKLDAAIADYLNKSGYRYDIAADKEYQDFAKEYSQNSLRGKQQSREITSTLANGYTPSYAETVADEVYNDNLLNYANYYPAFAQAARQQNAAETAQAGTAAQIYADNAATRYARDRDAHQNRVAYMNYLADRYLADRQTDAQRYGLESDIYKTRLGDAASVLGDSRQAGFNNYLLNTQSAENAAKLRADNNEFVQKLAYQKAEDAYKERIAAAKAAANAAKAAETAAKKQTKAQDSSNKAAEKEQKANDKVRAKNTQKYEKDVWKIQSYLNQSRKLKGDEIYDLDYNKDGVVDNNDAVIAGKSAKAGKLYSPEASKQKIPIVASTGANEIIREIEASDLYKRVAEKGSAGLNSSQYNALVRKIEKKVEKIGIGEQAYVFEHFGFKER